MAAGGLGYAFMQYLGSTAQSGADYLLDLVNFDTLISDAGIIITGEGHADKQTLMGKLPERILKRAIKRNIPVHLMAGQVSNKPLLLAAGFVSANSIMPARMSLQEALVPAVARRNIIQYTQNFSSFT